MRYDERPWLHWYDPGVPAEIEDRDRTLLDVLETVVSRVPNRPALHFFGVTCTYGQVHRLSCRFANFLRENGCAEGDVIGIHLPNVPQFLIAMLGALQAGCAVTGVSPLLTSGELVHQLDDCRAKVLVTLDATFEKRLQPVAQELDALRVVVTTRIPDFLPWIKRVLARVLKRVPTGKVVPLAGKRVMDFQEILAGYSDDPPPVQVGPDDVCFIQYTGGTTGVPKGTLLTHRSMVMNLAQVDSWIQSALGSLVLLSAFPLFHLAGLALALCAIYSGSTQVLIPNPRDTKHIVREIARYKPSYLVNVPSLYLMLLEEPGFRRLDFSGLEFCLSSASPFPVDAIRALEQVVGAGKVLEVYGMTEASPVVTMNPRRGKRKTGTVGLPVPGTRVKLVDMETGTREVPIGEEGEIAVQGPQVMKGYLNKPEETRTALREHDGSLWLHTGDVGRMDEEGYLTVVDRTKDMLNVGGFKVFSREVEEKLHEHPAIELCAVVGVPNPQRPGTEVVKLVVKPREAYRNKTDGELQEEILAFAREHFSPYKVPKLIEIVDTIPLTPVGKVDKKMLRQRS